MFTNNCRRTRFVFNRDRGDRLINAIFAVFTASAASAHSDRRPNTANVIKMRFYLNSLSHYYFRWCKRLRSIEIGPLKLGSIGHGCIWNPSVNKRLGILERQDFSRILISAQKRCKWRDFSLFWKLVNMSIRSRFQNRSWINRNHIIEIMYLVKSKIN